MKAQLSAPPAATFDPCLEASVVDEVNSILVEGRGAAPALHLYVGSIFSVSGGDELSAIDTVLLLDHFHAYLYRCKSSNPIGEIQSIARYASEKYSKRELVFLAEVYRKRGFQSIYSAQINCFALRMTEHLCEGELLVADLATAEIRLSMPDLHPDIQRASRLEQAAEIVAPPTEELISCHVGSSLRKGLPPPCVEWMSADVGPIRDVALRLGPAQLPSAVARSSSPTPSLASVTGGKNFNAQIALSIARCEALERFHLMYPRPDQSLFFGSFHALGGLAMDPRPMFMGSSDRPRRWSPESRLYWTHVSDVSTNRSTMVPAQSVWFTSRLEGESIFALCSTSGCAMGASTSEAALFALLELIERDAYLVMWYLKRTCSKIIPEKLSSPRCEMLLHLAARDYPEYEFHILDLRCEFSIPVVGVVATRENGTGPRSIHSAAARLTVEAAVEKCLQDVIIELANHRTLATADDKELNGERLGPSTADEHRAIYYRDSSFSSLTFFPFRSVPSVDPQQINNEVALLSESDDVKEIFLSVVKMLARLHIPVLVKDITHPRFELAGLYCMRVLAPGLFPLWFGRHAQVEMTPRLSMLSSRLTGRTLSNVSELNLEPHPFS